MSPGTLDQHSLLWPLPDWFQAAYLLHTVCFDWPGTLHLSGRKPPRRLSRLWGNVSGQEHWSAKWICPTMCQFPLWPPCASTTVGSITRCLVLLNESPNRNQCFYPMPRSNYCLAESENSQTELAPRSTSLSSWARVSMWIFMCWISTDRSGYRFLWTPQRCTDHSWSRLNNGQSDPLVFGFPVLPPPMRHLQLGLHRSCQTEWLLPECLRK